MTSISNVAISLLDTAFVIGFEETGRFSARVQVDHIPARVTRDKLRDVIDVVIDDHPTVRRFVMCGNFFVCPPGKRRHLLSETTGVCGSMLVRSRSRDDDGRRSESIFISSLRRDALRNRVLLFADVVLELNVLDRVSRL